MGTCHAIYALKISEKLSFGVFELSFWRKMWVFWPKTEFFGPFELSFWQKTEFFGVFLQLSFQKIRTEFSDFAQKKSLTVST